MPRESTSFPLIFVLVYVAVVNCLAALFVYASIGTLSLRLADRPPWVSLVARTYCRYRQLGFPESTSWELAVRDHQAWQPPLATAAPMSARLIGSATAQVCPRFRLGSGEPSPRSGALSFSP